jgi:hypothetical protein
LLIDEAHIVSNGLNAVVSYTDYLVRKYRLGEYIHDLHYDN